MHWGEIEEGQRVDRRQLFARCVPVIKGASGFAAGAAASRSQAAKTRRHAG